MAFIGGWNMYFYLQLFLKALLHSYTIYAEDVTTFENSLHLHLMPGLKFS